MLKIAVCVSGGGTNLQAIIDGIEQKTITNTEIAVVISNNPGAYALERAKKHGIEAVCISPKEYESRAAFNEDFLRRLDAYEVDLVVLAGFLVVIPEQMIAKTLPDISLNSVEKIRITLSKRGKKEAGFTLIWMCITENITRHMLLSMSRKKQ